MFGRSSVSIVVTFSSNKRNYWKRLSMLGSIIRLFIHCAKNSSKRIHNVQVSFQARIQVAVYALCHCDVYGRLECNFDKDVMKRVSLGRLAHFSVIAFL